MELDEGGVTVIKKIMITGGAGFVGTNLVKMLRGKYTLSALDNMSNKSTYFNVSDVSALHECDIQHFEKLPSLFEGHDAIIHLAASGSVVQSVKDPRKNFYTNVLGTFNVLEAARLARVTKIILASTGGALIGESDVPVHEQMLPKPKSPYGSSKLAGEAYAQSYASTFDLDITALRFANVLGRFCDRKRGLLNLTFDAIKNRNTIEIYGDGTSTRDYLDVRDLCEAIRLTIDADLRAFNAIHVSSGQETSVVEFIDKACALAGTTAVQKIFRPQRRGEVNKNSANNELANKLLGFVPKHELEETLNYVWRWYDDQNLANQ